MSGKLGIWSVLYRSGQDAAAVPLKGEAGYWYADPLLFSWQGKTYLFLEAFFMPLQIGHIAVSVYENGRFGTPRVVLKTPYHKSYPCVFDFHGQAYMIPETSQNGTLELWKSSGNLTVWEKAGNFLEGVNLADSTVYLAGEEILLFSWDEAALETRIYRLDVERVTCEEQGRIRAESDTKRPAGNFFPAGGGLYRPVQNNVHCYGESILIQKVESLSPFSEKFCREIRADVFSDANRRYSRTHTYGTDGTVEVFDVLEERTEPFYYRLLWIRKLRNAFFRVRNKVKWRKSYDGK